MDTVSDHEVEGIWKRVKHYIAPSQIQGQTPEEARLDLERQLQGVNSEVLGKSGNMQRLLSQGFVERALEVPSIRQELVSGVKPTVVARKELPSAKIPSIPGFTQRAGGRVAFKTSTGRMRVFKSSSLKTTSGSFKGRKAVFVSSFKTGKRITWRLLK